MRISDSMSARMNERNAKAAETAYRKLGRLGQKRWHMVGDNPQVAERSLWLRLAHTEKRLEFNQMKECHDRWLDPAAKALTDLSGELGDASNALAAIVSQTSEASRVDYAVARTGLLQIKDRVAETLNTKDAQGGYVLGGGVAIAEAPFAFAGDKLQYHGRELEDMADDDVKDNASVGGRTNEREQLIVRGMDVATVGARAVGHGRFNCGTAGAADNISGDCYSVVCKAIDLLDNLAGGVGNDEENIQKLARCNGRLQTILSEDLKKVRGENAGVHQEVKTKLEVWHDEMEKFKEKVRALDIRSETDYGEEHASRLESVQRAWMFIIGQMHYNRTIAEWFSSVFS